MKKVKTICLLGLLCLAMSACTHSMAPVIAAALEGDPVQQYQYGKYLLQKGKQRDAQRQAALKWFLESAQQNYAPAQVALAACYQFGLCSPVDEEQARYWYKKAAKQKDINAYKGLVSMAVENQDLKAALPWMKALAEAGDTGMQMIYANLLTEGIIIEPDEKLAVNYWRYAAIAGNDEACFKMGVCYAQGWGIPQNERMARLWWKMAADKGNSSAKKILKGN